MTNTACPVLCGGTFLTQILQSRKPTATRRQRTQGVTDIFREPDVLLGLVKIIRPDYIKPAGNTFRTFTTNYKKCAEYTPDDLKFDNETVVSAFLMRLEKEYAAELKKATAFANQFIDLGTTAKNDVLLVKRLIELIRDDTSIPNSSVFSVSKDGSPITKSELPKVTEVYLPSLLLSIWKFIVTERKDNSIGAATIAAWFPVAKGRYAGIDGSSIKQAIKVDCDSIFVADEDVNGTDDEEGSADENEETGNSASVTEPQTGFTIEKREINTDYYNLFVIGYEIKNCRFAMPKDRSLRSDSETVKKFSDFSKETILQIKTFPSLFMNENTEYGGRTSPEQEAYYGFVTDLIVQENGIIKVRFRCEAKLNQQQINDIARLLDIYCGPGLMELNHTHWTIKNVDLIEELTEAELLPKQSDIKLEHSSNETNRRISNDQRN